jgi:predicted dehydrogenase
VVNVTSHAAHKEVVTRCLKGGRHVFSEKPLAMTYEEARELVELSDRQGTRLGCAPSTFLGEAQQTAMKWLRDGRLGRVRVIYCDANWGRIESWHPNPIPFFAVGPLFDVGLYPLTLATAVFGPAQSVTAYGSVVMPDRQTIDGTPYEVQTPDFVVAVVELPEGVVVRLTVNFYVGNHSKQGGMEFHGDRASLFLGSWQDFDTPVQVSAYNDSYKPVDYVKEPFPGTEWGRGLADLVDAISEDRPHRASGPHAAHVVEILCAIDDSIRRGGRVELSSTFTPPEPMPWAR